MAPVKTAKRTKTTNSAQTIVKPSRRVAKLEAYTPRYIPQNVDRDQLMMADWNESLIAPSPLVVAALKEALGSTALHQYPDLGSTRLRKSLSAYTKLDSDWIQTFCGLDHAFEVICSTYLDEGDRVLICGPTYDNFRAIASCNTDRVEVVLGADPFSAKPDRLLSAVDASTKLIYLVNPNNPTGSTYSESQICQLLEGAPKTMLLVDEAYFEFYGSSVAQLVSKYKNLIVARSFSKAFGLAGLRVGYLLSDPVNLASINKVRNGKHVSALSQVAAEAALRDLSYMRSYVKEVKESMNWLSAELNKQGIVHHSTLANFILISANDVSSLIQNLNKSGILVRDRSRMPQLQGFVRITLGTQKMAQRLLRALLENKALLSKRGILA